MSDGIELERNVTPNVRRAISKNEGEATFEEAISATKFGKYNIFLFFCVLPAACSNMIETTTMSYVFVAAQCDLNLSLDDKGLLNAITYIGMISSGTIWGFMIDTFGRKKLMAVGFLVDSLLVFLSSFSQDIILLMICKYFGGAVVNGPFAAMRSYYSEFHASEYRPRIQLLFGTMTSIGKVVLPMLAWLILPMVFQIHILDFNFQAWNLFLLVCGLPAFTSGILFLFLPESPKFLMTCGRNEEALKVFRKVYSVNTGMPEETYPIKKLVDERKEYRATDNNIPRFKQPVSKVFKERFLELKPMFTAPGVYDLILVCTVHLCIGIGSNILRLWLPQIFQAMSEYKTTNNDTDADLCNMLELLTPEAVQNATCEVNLDNPEIYISLATVTSVSLLGFFIAGFLINWVGKKKLLVCLGLIAGSSSLSLYFAQSSIFVAAMSSIYLASINISGNINMGVIVEHFPTNSRTLTIALAMSIFRTGAIVGNILFPDLLRTGCQYPFIFIGTFAFGVSLFGLFLPNTEKKALR